MLENYIKSEIILYLILQAKNSLNGLHQSQVQVHSEDEFRKGEIYWKKNYLEGYTWQQLLALLVGSYNPGSLNRETIDTGKLFRGCSPLFGLSLIAIDLSYIEAPKTASHTQVRLLHCKTEQHNPLLCLAGDAWHNVPLASWLAFLTARAHV